MTKHTNVMLQAEIEKLIESQREGDHWDFKSRHQEKPGDLIKDVICLANTVRYKGDRYIIFGVDDNFQVVGVGAEGRRSQADILFTLGNAGFAGNIYPDVYLRQITIDEKQLDILVIKDAPEKPFYLQREYNKQGVKLNAGTIYTRVRDMNTGNDQVASDSDIEKMWRERFGLDATPFDRLGKYLLDFENWKKIEESHWYYMPFPEFTVVTASEPEKIEAEESWVRGATNPEAYFAKFYCKYHQTILWNGEIVYYDEMRDCMPNPDLDIIDEAEEWHHFYSFSMNDFKYLLLQFLNKERNKLLIRRRPFNSRGSNIPIIIFTNNLEKAVFKTYVNEHLQEFYSTPYDSRFDSMRLRSGTTEKDVEVLKFCSRLKNFYAAWIEMRARNQSGS